jgi:hypothetical protein
MARSVGGAVSGCIGSVGQLLPWHRPNAVNVNIHLHITENSELEEKSVSEDSPKSEVSEEAINAAIAQNNGILLNSQHPVNPWESPEYVGPMWKEQAQKNIIKSDSNGAHIFGWRVVI